MSIITTISSLSNLSSLSQEEMQAMLASLLAKAEMQADKIKELETAKAVSSKRQVKDLTRGKALLSIFQELRALIGTQSHTQAEAVKASWEALGASLLPHEREYIIFKKGIVYNSLHNIRKATDAANAVRRATNFLTMLEQADFLLTLTLAEKSRAVSAVAQSATEAGFVLATAWSPK